MSTQLVRYEQARQALAECHKVDEVKDIRDKAQAMAAYAQQAKDQDLILWATEIKVRAERRAGEMLNEAAARGEMAKRGHPPAENKPATLSDLGIYDTQAKRWKQLAAMPAEHFETAVATARESAGQVTTAFMLREAAKHKPAAPPKKGPKADAMRQELKEAQQRGVSMLNTYARLTLNAVRATEVLSQQERELLQELVGAIHQHLES